jgi:hypothetical protein
MKFGAPAVAAAATNGAHYLDSTGEPPFVREVFERYDPAARESGCGLVSAFGYDYVPGNLAGALALEQAGERAARVDVGYFFTGGGGPGDLSGGTRISLLGTLTEQSYAYRGGRVHTERTAARWRGFDVDGKQRDGVSIGSSEHFALPRLAPQLQEVNAYLGWFGPFSRVAPSLSLVSSAGMKLPGASKLWIAYDASGESLAEVHLSGIDPYSFTGLILAWGAESAAAGGLQGSGALGPADGFGLRALEAGCAEVGLARTG